MEPINTRKLGRHKNRCIHDILKDIKELNIKNWPVCIQDRS